MQEVTCPHCENIVKITPDAPVCSVCDADLRASIIPEAAAVYFYQRASDMATQGHRQQALTEVNRGLTYFDTSDLRLLGAILSNQVGDYGQMRNHVAAIPVDDALRSEGEWLLRSHQARQRGRRASAKAEQGAALPAALQGTDTGTSTDRRGQRTSWPLILAFVILILLAFLWFIGLPGTRNPEGVAVVPSSVAPATESVELTPANNAGEIGDEVASAADEEAGEASNVEGAEPAETESPTPLPTETLEPTPEPTPTEEAGASGPVDVPGYLDELGYVGLALLVDVEGELEDGVLRLSGEAPMMEDLELLVDVVAGYEGVDEVDTSLVTIEPPMTYTIQFGDSLWTISVRVYGDTEHMDDIFRLNREALGSPEYLPVGAEIELPRPSTDDALGAE